MGGACRKPSHCFGNLFNVSSRGCKSGLGSSDQRPGVEGRVGGWGDVKTLNSKDSLNPDFSD